MSDRARELGAYLRARRAAADPAEFEIRSRTQRRVPGLRREELAELAGVSSSYYTRIEQGQEALPSMAVIDAIARALRLGSDERAYLRGLAEPRLHPDETPEQVPPSLAGVIDATPLPALLLGGRMDVLRWNPASHRLFFDDLPVSAATDAAARPNWARRLFLHQPTVARFARWEESAEALAQYLRLLAGSYPDDEVLTSLIDELRADSPWFADFWARYQVGDRTLHRFTIDVPGLGAIELVNNILRPPDHPRLTVVLLHAEPGSTSESRLADLGR